jgi:hypothetical protein
MTWNTTGAVLGRALGARFLKGTVTVRTKEGDVVEMLDTDVVTKG